MQTPLYETRSSLDGRPRSCKESVPREAYNPRVWCENFRHRVSITARNSGEPCMWCDRENLLP